MTRNHILLLLFYLLGQSANLIAQDAIVQDSTAAHTPKKDGYLQRLLHGNVDHTFDRAIDISFAAAPSYTHEGSFGLGGMAAGLYRLDRSDSAMPPSDVSLFGNASLKGFYSIGIESNTYFKGRKSRLSYDVSFETKILDFWGITYDACSKNPVIGYTRRKIKLNVNYQYEIARHLYSSPVLQVFNASIAKIANDSYLEGQNRSCFFAGAGLRIMYDSRDFILQPKRGAYLMVQEVVYPRGMGNGGATFLRTTVTIDYYQPLWKECLLAVDFYGEFNSTDAPWALREELGNARRMRGYYSGRYTDVNILACQMELRQHVYKRFGAVAWVGCGGVFPALSDFRLSRLLPTYGIGARIEFKHNVNIKIDYGFGKQTGSFMFGIGEAF